MSLVSRLAPRATKALLSLAGLVSLAVGTAGTAGTALGVAPVMPRTPVPSPDASTIAFSWQGDLWLVPAAGGTARRLTAHPAYDHHPVWYADGKRIAFASDREGADDVFVLDLAGGEPRRLTAHEAADVPRGLLGEDVLFTSRRHEAWDRKLALYRVPSAGGTERLAASVLALEAAVSPDGKRLALVRGGTPAERRHYRGAANRDLFLLDLATGKTEQLTKTPYDEDGVAWAGPGALVYRSDAGGADRQLFRLDLATGTSTQLTKHAGVDVRSPAVSADGKLAAFELWDAAWTVPVDGSAPAKKLAIDVPGDSVESATEKSSLKADAEEAVVSPDGTQVALVVKGDIFVVARRSKELVAVAEPPTVRVTATPARELDLAWSPDGKTLAFASDRGGTWQLYTVSPAGRSDGKFFRAVRFDEKRLTDGKDDAREPRFSPDGRRIAFVAGRGGLSTVNADGSGRKDLFAHWGRTELAWSPDGKWLAFSREDRLHNPDVFLMPSEGGRETNVSQHPQEDVKPVFSPDGRRLYWLSRRHERGLDVWSVALSRADHERTTEEWIQLYEEEKPGKAKEADGKEGKDAAAKADGKDEKDARDAKDAKEKKAVKVVVDLEGIHERAKMLKALPGDETEIAVSPDGQTIAFAGQADGEKELYKIRWDGKELGRLTTGGADPSQLSFSRDGKTVFYRSGKGTVGSATVADGKPGDPVPFTAKMDVHRAELRAEVFDEAWRELDRAFYDPKFHGQDWKALHDRYRPLALGTAAKRDFEDVVNLMLGELNASHMGFRLPAERIARAVTGELGIEAEPAPDGKGVVVTEVLRDSPASRVDVGLKAGDRIVAVEGKEIGPRDNFSLSLSDRTGERISLKVSSGGAEREVALTPVKVDDGRQRRYETWVRERRAIVESLSKGRLGYVHIQGMSFPSLEEFERDLFAAANGKEGLLIDVRNNGGGSTTDWLMAILNVKRHAWTVPRGADPSVKGYPQDRLPVPAWTRPAATLCDEASYSNAEIFSWAFQTLKRGPVIGKQTFGAVLSTGAARLVDGSTVRLPGRGWYVAGSGINEENNGCKPDVEVEKAPAEDLSKTVDSQLAKGVEVLLGQLPKEPAQLPW